jgi:hypothetical protein
MAVRGRGCAMSTISNAHAPDPGLYNGEHRKVRVLTAMVLLLAVAVVVLAALRVSDGESDATERQRAVSEQVVATWNEADGDAFAALFAKDGVLSQYLLSAAYPEPLFVYEGRDEIAAGIDAYAGIGFHTWFLDETILTGGPFYSRSTGWTTNGGRGGSGIVVTELGDGRIRNLWVYSQEAPPGTPTE